MPSIDSECGKADAAIEHDLELRPRFQYKTPNAHKSLDTSKGAIRSRDSRYCSKEEMVEERSGITHARRIKVRRDEDKIQTDVAVLTF
ncbi:Gag-like protein [Plakobranchus ocellatus]|uniref:Gag-like protein n=1 Tax=Plakobranchus ocellatus TaxID=259542 RepID=A0AAV4CRZ6_9GAST|nr:Gag-like protein [Plakobranchus ocellatus]